MDRSRYPRCWEQLSLAIRRLADWHCQECGKPCRRPGESIEDLRDRLEALDPINGSYWIDELFEDDWDDELGLVEVAHPRRFTLTIAHLDHVPENCNPRNLKAMCAPCHIRYDGKQMRRKRALKREFQGQLNLLKGA